MKTVKCWWLADITCPSRSLPQQSPTIFSWGLSWSTCASSMRAIQHAHVCCLKVSAVKWWLTLKSSTCLFSILPLHQPLRLAFVINFLISYTLFVVPLTVIGQRLAAMNLLSPLAISDEFSTVRLQHNRAFTELLHAASSSLYPQVTGQITCTW